MNELVSQVKSPFSLELLLASELTRSSVKDNVDGSYSKFDTSLLYRLDPKNELRAFLSTRFITNDKPEQDKQLQAFFAELMYRRKALLTENRNGLNLEAELKLLRLLDGEIQDDYGYNYSLIPQLIFRKKLGRGLSAKLRVKKYFYNQTSDNSYVLEGQERVYLDITKFLNRKYMINGQLKYENKIRNAEGPDYRFMELAKFDRGRMDLSDVRTAFKNNEIITLHIGLLKFLEAKNMVEFYLESQLDNNYDSRSISEKIQKEWVAGVALYLTAL